MKYQIVVCMAVFCALFPASEAKPSMLCAPRSTFKVQCNTCRCNTDGTNMVCTKLMCVDDEDTENKQDSTNGQMEDKMEKTEEVAAVENKPEEAAAEDRKTEEAAPEETKMDEKKVEQEGGEMKTSSATQEQSHSQANSQQAQLADMCNPGEMFRRGCNECSCPPSGLKSSAVCTLLACNDTPVADASSNNS